MHGSLKKCDINDKIMKATKKNKKIIVIMKKNIRMQKVVIKKK